MNEITPVNPGAAQIEAPDNDAAFPLRPNSRLLGAILTDNEIFDRIAAIITKVTSMIRFMRGSMKRRRRGSPKTISHLQ